MTVYTNNKHLQEVLTQTVMRYVSRGWLLLLQDCGTNYLTHVDLQRGKRRIRIYMVTEKSDTDVAYIDALPKDQQFLARKSETISLYIRDVETGIELKQNTFYRLATENPSQSCYTDSLSEYQAQARKHYERLATHVSASALPMINDQKKLKEIVKGQTGFGKKALQGATLMLVRYFSGYKIVNSKTEDVYQVNFPTI